jgi:heme exporter protein C
MNATETPVEAAIAELRLGPPSRWLWGTTIVGALAFIGTQIWGFSTPPDANMGNLVKIMFVHVPTAEISFLAVLVMFISSILYLVRRQERLDLLGAAGAEVGAVLTALTLVQGSIWGRPTWGVWWTWDARLTSEAVMLVILVGYLALRSFTEDTGRRARWSAAVAVLGALNSVIVYWSVQWWRTLHQPHSSPMTMATAYRYPFRANLITMLLVFIALVGWRYRAARIERAAELLREEEALNQGGAHAAL